MLGSASQLHRAEPGGTYLSARQGVPPSDDGRPISTPGRREQMGICVLFDAKGTLIPIAEEVGSPSPSHRSSSLGG